MKSDVPRQLRFRSELQPSPYALELSLKGDWLLFWSAESSEELQPTADDWRRFRRALNRIGVWHWLSQYEQPHLHDGHGWHFAVEYDDRWLDVHGSNAYPGVADGDHACVHFARTSPYRGLCRALSRLSAGHDIDGERVVDRNPERLVVKQISVGPEHELLADVEILFKAEGGAVYLATLDETPALLTDESAMEDFADPGDELATIRLFHSITDRNRYLKLRGWPPKHE